MSVLANQTNITPNDPYFASGPIIAGVTQISTTASTITVSAYGLTSTATVVASYIHPGVGAAAQAFNAITPGTNQIFFDLQQASANGESISWIAKA
jgi:hypothetical protein